MPAAVRVELEDFKATIGGVPESSSTTIHTAAGHVLVVATTLPERVVG